MVGRNISEFDKAKNYIDSSNIRQGGGEARKIYESILILDPENVEAKYYFSKKI